MARMVRIVHPDFPDTYTTPRHVPAASFAKYFEPKGWIEYTDQTEEQEWQDTQSQEIADTTG